MPDVTFESLLKRCEYNPANYQDHSDWFIAWMKLKEYLQIERRRLESAPLGGKSMIATTSKLYPSRQNKSRGK